MPFYYVHQQIDFKKSLFSLNTFVNIKILLDNITSISFIFLSTPIKIFITPKSITFALLIFLGKASLQVKYLLAMPW